MPFGEESWKIFALSYSDDSRLNYCNAIVRTRAANPPSGREAPGADGIPSELFKLAEEAIKKLTVLGQQIQNRNVQTGD